MSNLFKKVSAVVIACIMVISINPLSAKAGMYDRERQEITIKINPYTTYERISYSSPVLFTVFEKDIAGVKSMTYNSSGFYFQFLYDYDATGNNTLIKNIYYRKPYSNEEQYQSTLSESELADRLDSLTPKEHNLIFTYNEQNQLATYDTDYTGGFYTPSYIIGACHDRYEYQYNSLGQLTQTTYYQTNPPGVKPQTWTYKYIYNANNQLVKIDQYYFQWLNITKTYAYNELGQLTQMQVDETVTGQTNQINNFVYDAAGNIICANLFDGRFNGTTVYNMAYDEHGYVTNYTLSQYNKDNSVSEWSYIVKNTYDSQGRIISRVHYPSSLKNPDEYGDTIVYTY